MRQEPTTVGFWHVGYFEFHEALHDSDLDVPPPPPSYPCPECDATFATERDQRVHSFDGHHTMRPTLLLRGRECGRTRLTVSAISKPTDWAISHADYAALNNTPMHPHELVNLLSTMTFGVHHVTLANSRIQSRFEFDFSIADEPDLRAVDHKLYSLISKNDLNARTVREFFESSARGTTADRYLDGIASYLYGAIYRDKLHNSNVASSDYPKYREFYNRAAANLETFDRPPAEAICGLISFHYNQFDLAIARTKSGRISDISAHYLSILRGNESSDPNSDFPTQLGLDALLSDEMTELILREASHCIQATTTSDRIIELATRTNYLPDVDEVKLKILLAESLLREGDKIGASEQGRQLRHSALTEHWYRSFHERIEQATS